MAWPLRQGREHIKNLPAESSWKPRPYLSLSRQRQQVAMPDANGKLAPARLPQRYGLPLGDRGWCAGSAARAPSAVPCTSARAMRHAERGTRQSAGAEMTAKPRAASVCRATDGACVPSARPKPLSRPWSRRKPAAAIASAGWRGSQASRPSTLERGEKGRAQRRREPIEPSGGDEDPARRCTALRRRAPAAVLPARGPGPGRGPRSAMRRPAHGPAARGPARSRSSPTLWPMRRCCRTPRPAASIGFHEHPVLRAADDRREETEHAAGAGAEIQQRGRPGSRGPERAASATLRAARANGSRSASQWRRTAPSPSPRAPRRIPAPAGQRGSSCPTRHAASAISRRSPAPKISRRSAFDRLM